MSLYPLFADLRGLPVLVVGGGVVARRKAMALRQAGALVRVGAPQLESTLAAAVAAGQLGWLEGAYQPGWLDAVWLVIAATDERALNARVAADAAQRRVLVNVVDDAQLSRFHVPAVIDRAPLQIAISTAGAAPALAVRLREQIEQLIDPALGQLVALAQRQRGAIVRRFAETGARRRFYDWLHDGPVLALLRRGRPRQAAQAMQTALAQPAAPAVPGSVVLVGAGPGHPGLLTLQALRELNRADVILHDQLVSPAILAMARRDAEFIDVGKRGGGRQVPQPQTHALMLMHARAGRRVLRLKGGDPFVFGRGGEELAWLRQHGVDCEVVPGITAAVACAAFAGIPLTHREHAQSVCLLSARGKDAADPLGGLPLGDARQTLAIYMGVEKLPALAAQLQARGRRADTPVALVENGSLPQQRVVTGTLAELPGLAGAHAVRTPALLIVGAVAAFARRHAWHGALAPAQAVVASVETA